MCRGPTRSACSRSSMRPRAGGLYRSDDAGESWQRVNGDRRLWGRGDDFAEVKIDPKNKDVVYVANIGLYRSTDGGKSFTCFKGAPGGDDYHTVWINPDDPNDILLVAADQGAIVTVNGGETWSSWYNQPTAQFYHVDHGQSVPLLGVWRPAGERFRRRGQPRERRADHPARLAHSRCRRVRLRRSRPAEPGHHLSVARCRSTTAAPVRCRTWLPRR